MKRVSGVTQARSRFDALKAALSAPERVPAALLKACGSQGELAGLLLPAQGIEPVSLNALKAGASKLAELGGWARLDELRVQLRSAGKVCGLIVLSEAEAKRKRRTRRNEEEKQRFEQSHRLRLRIGKAYTELLRLTAAAGARDSQTKLEFDQHVALWAETIASAAVGEPT